MRHYVYRITNKYTGEFYIGKRSSPTGQAHNDYYWGSGRLIGEQIARHGTDAFMKDVLAVFGSAEEALAYEAKLVTPALIKSELCLNLVPGGTGGWQRKPEAENSCPDLSSFYVPTEATMSAITIEAISSLDFLCTPKRLLFADYFREARKGSSYAAIKQYFSEMGLSADASYNAHSGIREGLFAKLTTNMLKQAYLGGAAQAYYDLCIAESIYTGEELLTVGEKLRVVLQTLDELVDFLKPRKEAKLSLVGLGEHIKPENKQFAVKRITDAVQILEAWRVCKVGYTDSYSEVLAKLPLADSQ